jgi:SAM-dependent methyltransferase
VGQFRFVDLSLSRQPSYAAILSRLLLKTDSGGSKERLLDVGCCFAQDLRKLAYDGAPSESLYGLEIQSEFIDLGYEFFGDRDSFRGRFINADLLDRENVEVKEVEGTFGVVQLGMVLHIWDLEGQTRACERVVELLRDEKGVLVVGQSVGNVEAKEAPGRGKKIYKHDVGSFERMWAEVGRRTGTKWEVRARLDQGLGIDERKREWDEPSTRRLSFEVERV